MTGRWGDGKPFPVVIVTGDTARSALRLKPVAAELRLDLCTRLDDKAVRKLAADLKKARCSILLTVRRQFDGGLWPDANEKLRREFILQYAPLASIIDIETDVLADERAADFVKAIGKVKGKPAILASLHDCRGVPSEEELDRHLEMARAAKAVRFKVAALGRGADEADALARWALSRRTKKLPITAIAMGPAGRWTRWVLPRLAGGPAYAPVDDSVAPGQIPYRELITLLA